MTLAQLLAQAQKEQLRLEMELFLSHLLGKSRLDLIAHSDEELPVEHLGAIQKGWTQLKAAMPVAYLTHEKEFFGLSFYVDERVLIPRPCTEQLVEWALELEGQGRLKESKVLEIGTGSGAIAVALKKSCPRLQIWATDLSEGALEVASKNCVQNEVEISLFCSDLLSQVPEQDFDLLLANLPYIGTEMHAFVQESVAKYEPSMALFSGQDGLDLYRRLFAQIQERAHSFPLILGEIGFSQGEAVRALAAELLPHYVFHLRRDLEGLDRHFLLERKADFC